VENLFNLWGKTSYKIRIASFPFILHKLIIPWDFVPLTSAFLAVQEFRLKP
jgi:hypothetical protein